MRYLLFFVLTVAVWPQTQALTSWKIDGLKGAGVQAKAADSGFFVWTDFQGSGAGGLQAGGLILGNLEWNSLSLAASRRDLPNAWDGAWTQNRLASLRYRARTTKVWAAAIDIDTWLAWVQMGNGQNSLGLGWLSAPGPWFSGLKIELEARYRTEEEKLGWFERPRSKDLSWRSQVRLGWGGLNQGMDVLGRLEKTEARRPTYLVGLRLGLSPLAWARLHSLVSFDNKLNLQQRIELDGRWIRAVQRWDLDGEHYPWKARSLSTLSLGLGTEGLKLKVGAELDLDQFRVRQDLAAELGLGWQEWFVRVGGQWLPAEEIRLQRTTGSLGYESRIFNVDVRADIEEDKIRGELRFEFRHPEVQADLSLPWDPHKGPGSWTLTLSRTF